MLAELMQVAQSAGLEVRSRVLRGSHPTLGGLCRLDGRRVVLLSSKATPLEQCAVLAQALAELGRGDHPGLGAASRALVERRGRPHPGSRPAPAGPGLAGLGGGGRRRL